VVFKNRLAVIAIGLVSAPPDRAAGLRPSNRWEWGRRAGVWRHRSQNQALGTR